MSSFEHLDVLRRQNKELLQKLKLKPGKLHFECSRTQNENTTPEAGKSAENSARDPKERNAEMAPGCLTGEEAERVSEDTVYDVALQERAEGRLLPPVNPTRQMKPESVISQEKSQRVSGRVRFPHEDDESESESESESERPRLQPLLGYDWIAGLLDAESSLTERSELFFRELRTFRQVNSEECIYSIPSRVSIPRATLLPAYHYKAHRRCSFDPSDSLDLPSHCLSGWTNISMGVGYKMSSLDLRNSIEIRPNSGTVPSTQDESQMDVSGSRASGRQSSAQLPELSRLARCARVGMFVIKEGSSTADRVCGHQTIRPHILTEINAVKTLYTPDTTYTPEALYTPDTPDTKTQSLAPSTVKPLDVTSAASETTAASWLSQPKIAQMDREGPLQPSETLSKTTWIFMFLLLLALCLVSCLFLQCKRRAIKKNLAWAGRAFGRYQPVSATANPHAKTLLPVSDLREARGQGSFPGGNQQVTMEHKGKADGINNTVGSIFIYSPGMVVLGSNSNEKKEETETSGEDAVEDVRLISVPQQESSSERDVRMATQEELGKELSVPVPATSK
ncbi:Migration and invasion-inhibitory protein [Bagarius yarrelli]|uniref:Migration and invasion-inhibitory protein n=1 Tax=Bagarius yarrelli TaxID=175774 RepID=A0A556V4R0_BAGYA|nr:Migration and invasion-inhibitory protein [Bagarius yarrelli]